jgi:hypothetical protein
MGDASRFNGFPHQVKAVENGFKFLASAPPGWKPGVNEIGVNYRVFSPEVAPPH